MKNKDYERTTALELSKGVKFAEFNIISQGKELFIPMNEWMFSQEMTHLQQPKVAVCLAGFIDEAPVFHYNKDLRSLRTSLFIIKN